MGLPSNWRSSAAADDYANHDFADFAQEFLRRNPDYQADFKIVDETGPSSDEPDQRDAIANKWGLVFRLRSETRSTRRASPLASRSLASGAGPGSYAIAVLGYAHIGRSSRSHFPLVAAA